MKRVCTSCVRRLRAQCPGLGRSSILLLYLRLTSLSPFTVTLYFNGGSTRVMTRHGCHVGDGVRWLYIARFTWYFFGEYLCVELWERFTVFIREGLGSGVAVHSFVVCLGFIDLLTIYLFTYGRRSSGPVLRRMSSLLRVGPSDTLAVLGGVSILRSLPRMSGTCCTLLLTRTASGGGLPLLPYSSLLGFTLSCCKSSSERGTITLVCGKELLTRVSSRGTTVRVGLGTLRVLRSCPMSAGCEELVCDTLKL